MAKEKWADMLKRLLDQWFVRRNQPPRGVPDKPTPPPPPPEEPTLPVQLLEVLEFENASSRPNGSLQLSAKYTNRIESVHINGIKLSDPLVWGDNSTIWYGPKIESYTAPIEAVMIDKSGNKHMALLKAEYGQPDAPETEYSTRFHHTQTDGPDQGQSLVLCPGQKGFDKVMAGDIELPLHPNRDEGRISYWNMRQFRDVKYISAWRDGKEYRFRANKNASRGIVKGGCYGQR